MTDADYSAELIAFTEELRRALRAAGGPSYAELARLALELPRQQAPGGVKFVELPRSSTSEILSGQRKNPLKWPWVMTFISALREAARQGGINPAAVGSLEEWRLRYDVVLAAKPARPRPVRAGGATRHGTPSGVGVLDRTVTVASQPADVADGDAGTNLTPEAFLRTVGLSVPQGRHRRQSGTSDRLAQYIELELLADRVETYETAVIPELLQTEEYARAVTALRLPDATPDEVSRLVSLVIERQALRGRQRRCQLWALIEEAALRNPKVDARIMRAQIAYLIDLTEAADNSLQIVPTGSESNLTRSEPMTILRILQPAATHVVFLGHPDRAIFRHDPKDTEYYRQLFISLTYPASQPADAKQVLTKILHEM